MESENPMALKLRYKTTQFHNVKKLTIRQHYLQMLDILTPIKELDQFLVDFVKIAHENLHASKIEIQIFDSELQKILIKNFSRISTQGLLLLREQHPKRDRVYPVRKGLLSKFLSLFSEANNVYRKDAIFISNKIKKPLFKIDFIAENRNISEQEYQILKKALKQLGETGFNNCAKAALLKNQLHTLDKRLLDLERQATTKQQHIDVISLDKDLKLIPSYSRYPMLTANGIKVADAQNKVFHELFKSMVTSQDELAKIKHKLSGFFGKPKFFFDQMAHHLPSTLTLQMPIIRVFKLRWQGVADKSQKLCRMAIYISDATTHEHLRQENERKKKQLAASKKNLHIKVNDLNLRYKKVRKMLLIYRQKLMHATASGHFKKEYLVYSQNLIFELRHLGVLKLESKNSYKIFHNLHRSSSIQVNEWQTATNAVERDLITEKSLFDQKLAKLFAN